MVESDRASKDPESGDSLGWAALAVAVVIAVAAAVAAAVPPEWGDAVPRSSWLAWRSGVSAHSAALADETWGDLRRSLPPGAAVGWLVPDGAQGFMAREVEAQRFFGAQYALAPAVLRPIYAPECRARGLWACGIGRLDFLLAPSGLAGAVDTRDIRFVPKMEWAGMLLLERRR